MKAIFVLESVQSHNGKSGFYFFIMGAGGSMGEGLGEEWLSQ